MLDLGKKVCSSTPPFLPRLVTQLAMYEMGISLACPALWKSEVCSNPDRHRRLQVAECAFDFSEHQRSCHHLQNVPAGFKLSTLMAGRGVDRSTFAEIDHKLHKSMLELSRKIIRGVSKACKDSNSISFV